MTVKIPLVLALWHDKHFGGTNLASEANVASANFNDVASSIGVHPGPDFDPASQFSVSVFSDSNFQGKELCLSAGTYPDLKDYDFNDCISSVRFNGANSRNPGLYINGVFQAAVGPQAAAQAISPIPAVVQLFVPHSWRTGVAGLGPGYSNFHYITVVQSEPDLGANYGSEFSNSVTRAVVAVGPSPGGALVRLYREANPDTPQGHIQGGGHIDLTPDPNASINPQVIFPDYDLKTFGFEKQTNAVGVSDFAAVRATPTRP
jgi:hypothetical protein